MSTRYARGLYVCLTLAMLGDRAPLFAAAATATAGNGDVVLFAKNASVISGAWSLVDDATPERRADCDADAGVANCPRGRRARDLRSPFRPKPVRHIWIRDRSAGDSGRTFDVRAVQQQPRRARRVPHRHDRQRLASIEEAQARGRQWLGLAGQRLRPGRLRSLYFDGTTQTARAGGLSIRSVVLSLFNATAAPGAATYDHRAAPTPPAGLTWTSW
jgi:hypothetical protein